MSEIDKTGTIRTQLIAGLDVDGNLVPVKVASDGSLTGGGGSSGASAAEIKTAIQAATNLDQLETKLDILTGQINPIGSDFSSLSQAFLSTIEDLEYIESLIGDTASEVATSDTDPTSLISLFKRLLSVKLGEQITGTTIPAGGSGIRGLLSWIAKLISDRLPSALVSDRLKVDLGNSISSPIYISPASATPQPISGIVTANIGTIGNAATAANQATGNTFAANIDTRLTSALILDRFKTNAILDSTAITASANQLNGLIILSTDCSNYSFLSLQITGIWSGVITFEFSNDNTNWVGGVLYNLNFVGVPNTVTTSNSIYYGNKQGRYFRARFSVYNSGVATGTLSLSSCPTTPAYPVTIISGTPSVNLATVNNLSPDIATQTTLSAINNKLPVLLADRIKVNAAGASLTLSGSAVASNVDIISAVDVSDYSWIGFQLSGIWSGTVVAQFSNNNIDWNNVTCYSSAGVALINITAIGLYSIPKQGRYFRLRAIAYFSGTFIADIQANTNAPFSPMGAAAESTLSLFNGKFPNGIALSDSLSRTANYTLIACANMFDNGLTLVRGRVVPVTFGEGLGRQVVSTATGTLTLLFNASTTGAGGTFALGSGYKTITAQLIISSGSAITIYCVIEGSLNGVNWFTLAVINDGTNSSKASSDGAIFTYCRANVTALTGTVNFSVLACAVI